MQAILEARAITKKFKQGSAELTVLDGVTASFAQGSSYAITGISGSGKSTLLHILAGLELPTQGMILFNNKDIALLPSHERSAFLSESLGLLFQLPYLIDELSVVENVAVKGMIAGLSYAQAIEQAQKLLNVVELGHKADARPATLSGGQQQRVAIVRALLNKPTFLLADEPTGSLDAATGRDLIDFLLDCQAQWQLGIIISSHDTYLASRMQQVFTLNQGTMS